MLLVMNTKNLKVLLKDLQTYLVGFTHTQHTSQKTKKQTHIH